MLRLLRVRTVDATQGSIVKLLAIYTLPIIISTIIQDLFNTIDMAVLARLGSEIDHASVSTTNSITSLIVNSFFGLSTGVKIMLSRYCGASDKENAEKTVNTAIISSFLLGLVISAIGFFLSPFFLKITNCPAECYDKALFYIRMYVAGAPAILVYNFGSSILRSIGDSQRPLYYIIFSGLLNVMLNVILCLILPQKVAAVAIATVASQILGAALVVIRLCKIDGMGHINIFKMKWDAGVFVRMMKYGVPVAISNSLVPLSTLQIQSAINSYGFFAISGNNAATALEKIPNAIVGGFSAATMTFVGQNIGAENPERVRKSVIHCMWMCCAVATFAGLFLYFTSDLWLSLILPDAQEAFYYAKIRLLFILCFDILLAMSSVHSGVIQALGHTLLNTVTSLLCIFGVRMLWMWFVYPIFENYYVLMLCFTVSWILRAVLYAVFFTVIFGRYKRGAYKRV